MNDKIMCTNETRGSTFYFIAVVFVACYLAGTAECYRRWKPLRVDVRKEADLTETVGVYEGQILFGKSVKELLSQLMNDTNQSSSNASVEDKDDFQADIPEFPYGQMYTNAWNQMPKSLQCGADQMDFAVIGSGNQHFAVNQLNGPSMPLSVVPPSCGYNMQRFPLYLHLKIPYRGCNMIKRGGHYMLPLTWRGIPIVLSCQMPRTPLQNLFPWYPTPLPPFNAPTYPWYGQPAEPTQPIRPPQDPWPMDPWPAKETGVQPWHPIIPPTTTSQMHFPHPDPWYHNHPHYHNHPYDHHKHPCPGTTKVPTTQTPHVPSCKPCTTGQIKFPPKS